MFLCAQAHTETLGGNLCQQSFDFLIEIEHRLSVESEGPEL